MEHGPRSRNSGAIFKPATSQSAPKNIGGKRPREDVATSKQPIKTVRIIRKVECSSNLEETDAELQIGVDVNPDTEAKEQCFFLIVKTDNDVSPGSEKIAASPSPKRPKLTVEPSLTPLKPSGRGQFVKVRKEALQSLPKLRKLIDYHRSRQTELIQENQLYDSSLGIQHLSLPISPVRAGSSTKNADFHRSRQTELIQENQLYDSSLGIQHLSLPISPVRAGSSTGNALGESPPVRFRFKRPPKVPSVRSKNLFKAGEKEVPSSPTRGGQFRPQVILPKGYPGHLFALNRQEVQLKIPEVWPLHQNAPSLQQCVTQIRPVTPKSVFPNLTSAGMLPVGHCAAKENIPMVKQHIEEPKGIIYPDELLSQAFQSKSPVYEIKFPSVLDYQNVTILGDDFPQDYDPKDGNQIDSRAKRVLEEFDLLNSPETCFDPFGSGYIPNNPEFDFKSLDVEIRKETAEVQESVQPFQDPFLDEIFEVLRHEMFDPFQQPLASASFSSESHVSKETDAPKNEKTPLSGNSAALRWKCKLCSEKHATKNSLITHLKKHQQPFCHICLTVTSSEKKLRTHTLKAHPSNDRQELLSLDGVIVTSKYGRRRAILDAATLCGRKRLKSRDSV